MFFASKFSPFKFCFGFGFLGSLFSQESKSVATTSNKTFAQSGAVDQGDLIQVGEGGSFTAGLDDNETLLLNSLIDLNSRATASSQRLAEGAQKEIGQLATAKVVAETGINTDRDNKIFIFAGIGALLFLFKGKIFKGK